jgi:small subunit ribosomal protein S21
MKRRKAYEKPSERKTREKAEAIRRVRKAARKQAQRDGLIPMPKRREDVRRSVARPDHPVGTGPEKDARSRSLKA